MMHNKISGEGGGEGGGGVGMLFGIKSATVLYVRDHFGRTFISH